MIDDSRYIQKALDVARCIARLPDADDPDCDEFVSFIADLVDCPSPVLSPLLIESLRTLSNWLRRDITVETAREMADLFLFFGKENLAKPGVVLPGPWARQSMLGSSEMTRRILATHLPGSRHLSTVETVRAD
jgi:hypothetical protein